MPSVILVPVITLMLLVLLYFLLLPRRKQDSPAAAQYQIRRAQKMLNARAQKFGKNDFKKLDFTVGKIKNAIERARNEDVYDMTFPFTECEKAREITQALIYAAPADLNPYFERINNHLSAVSTYICAYCGVSGDAHGKMSLKVFSKKAKAEKAERFLQNLNDDQKKE